MSKVAVVTGAGSGVGRAVVSRLAREGWNVALVGRSIDSLNETIRLAGRSEAKLLAFPCDVASEPSVREMCEGVTKSLGEATVLVNSAGTNVKDRSMDVLSIADFQRMIDTNLSGVFYTMHAFLPGMKRAGGGTIVNINSDSAIAPSAKAGGGYAASKFGLRGLTQAISLEQRQYGIRCCAILPGDINTPLLDKRPAPPSAEARTKMLQPEDVAECVMLAINLPQHAVVEELLIRPR